MWKAKQPYNVNVAGTAAALASLADTDELAENVALLRQERTRLFELLSSFTGLQVPPSQANFILCKVKNMPAIRLKEELAQGGILVRYYNNRYLKDYIRVSVGRPQDSEILFNALQEIFNEKPTRITATADSALSRQAKVERQTRETLVEVRLKIDGRGHSQIRTGLPFFDHMLQQIAVHGLFDLDINARGDLEIDPHHTVEDTALALGDAFQKALGERRGLVRTAAAYSPMDESLAWVCVDFSGRPYTVLQGNWTDGYAGDIPLSLFKHFLESFAGRAGCNLHARIEYGNDTHHQIEAIFKALGRVLDAANRHRPPAGPNPSPPVKEC